MSAHFSRGLAPGAVGAAILAHMAFGWFALRADAATVYFFGRPIAASCGFKARTGLPCPTCGLSRGVALSLHEEWGKAWTLSPLGPLLVGGCFAISLALLGLAAAAHWRANAAAPVERAVRRGALAYAGAATAVWLAGWAWSFVHALNSHVVWK